jgi:hypothetical protein
LLGVQWIVAVLSCADDTAVVALNRLQLWLGKHSLFLKVVVFPSFIFDERPSDDTLFERFCDR